MDNLTFTEEKNKFEDTLNKVNKAYDVLNNSLKVVGKDNLEKLKDLRENPETSGADFHFFLEQLNQENTAFNLRDKLTRVDEFANMVKQPYFARIDIKNEDEKKSLYIGKFGYTEKEPVIIDWRAKIASIYYKYRYPQKKVTYIVDDNKFIYDLDLKRTFDIDNGVLIKYYNNDIQLDESEIILDKLSKRTGGVLEDIVETIQESQLNIIESDPRKICIVQGCVGSGKSTVAIHKLSHIFFNHPNLIRPERSIIIAKNQILISYLSTLFPKLGIFDVKYQTLRELMVHIIFRENLKLNYDFNNQNILNFDINKINDLRSDIDLIHESTSKKIIDLFLNQDFETFGGFKYSKINTPLENITEAINDLEEEEIMQRQQYEEDPKSVKSLFYKENIKVLKKIIKKLQSIKEELVHRIFINILKKYGINQNDKYGYYQTLLYLSIYLELFGFKKFKKYEYCVVDEGQDFGLLEFYLLGKIIIRGRFCILGDLNQSIFENAINDWDDIKTTIVDAKNSQRFILDTNYRSTKPIIDLANNVINKFTNNFLPKSINRNGSEPKINNFDNFDLLKQDLSSVIKDDYDNLDKSIGFICMTQRSFDYIKATLSNQDYDKNKIIELNQNNKINYIPRGIYFMHFNDCKGLEFSKVYILELNLSKINSYLNAKKAFVAITRAMNELIIYNVTND
ncbi:hypothetical protein A2V49_01930 [candidate division WWE3 bacterium RBG_19FT_COMBO_34_6]|uniref:DNA 3'-5' helicase n=1 Tax=candidate division WWE3 bacterium RBG_19FT_COMBO_34_6 TaxID=1802612 RepID=A0A1F4ULY2_UNCKA|nr:MAG: hypothetical protein A2V49_01930 [candidate division WWE3 bacterium RBG_19FT_COMBO_34_6]